jgi:signal transduction histidine kinase
MIVLVLFVSILVYKYQQRYFDYKNGIKELKHQHENELLKAQIQVQENTFQNISREIHDNIGQKLTLAKLQLNTLLQNNNSIDTQYINNIVQLIGVSLNDLRDLSRSMSSDFIAQNGLIKAIEEEIGLINKTLYHQFKLTITGNTVFLDAEKEIILFRIIQESLNNIVKHAEATIVNIDIHFTNSDMCIAISDNGIGFDLTNANDGNGLINIKNRAISINAIIEIQSVKNTGTKVTIKLPLYDTPQNESTIG